MEIKKIIKSNIIYYYIAAVVFALLYIVGVNYFPMDSLIHSSLNLYIVLPLVALVLGFVTGFAKSYVKWGFPIYIAMLSFCLSVMLTESEDWIFILIGFGSSLLGLAIRHGIYIYTKRRHAR